MRTLRLHFTTIAKLRGYKNEKDWNGEFGDRNLARSSGILRGLYIADDTESEPRFNGSHESNSAWSGHHRHAGTELHDPAAIEPIDRL